MNLIAMHLQALFCVSGEVKAPLKLTYMCRGELEEVFSATIAAIHS